MMNKACFFYSRYSNTTVGITPLIQQGHTIYYNSIDTLLKKIIRKIAKILKLYWKIIPYILYGKGMFALGGVNIESFTYIVVFENAIEEYFCDFIEHNYPEKKLILYYINTICNDKKKTDEVERYRHSKWRIFSFDEQECAALHLLYNPYFFCGQYIIKKSISHTIKQIFFMGKIKSRKEKILFLKEGFDKLGIKNKIILVDTNKHDSSLIPYADLLTEVQKSEILLDIVNEGQAGATQRELEAVFLNKKLITDNQYIKTRKYYNNNNIFLVDFSKETPLEGIQQFLDTAPVKIDSEILKFYSIENWLSRFVINC